MEQQTTQITSWANEILLTAFSNNWEGTSLLESFQRCVETQRRQDGLWSAETQQPWGVMLRFAANTLRVLRPVAFLVSPQFPKLSN